MHTGRSVFSILMSRIIPELHKHQRRNLAITLMPGRAEVGCEPRQIGDADDAVAVEITGAVVRLRWEYGGKERQIY